MIHDPLCSREGDPFRTGWCNVCILIRAVRDDERARIRQAVEAIRHLLEGATVEEVLSIIDGDTYDGQWHRDLYGKD